MNAVPTERGTALLLAHCASFDPDAPSAGDRLEDALGRDLARKLVFALCGGAPRADRSPGELRARAVFAA